MEKDFISHNLSWPQFPEDTNEEFAWSKGIKHFTIYFKII